jgi:hypothetical protein
VPDAAIHWRLHGREGTFLLEWDRGSESLGILASKLRRYVTYWRARGHKELLPGLGLRPRLAVVLTSRTRADRLVRWLGDHTASLRYATILIAPADVIQVSPLARVWWRNDTSTTGALQD